MTSDGGWRSARAQSGGRRGWANKSGHLIPSLGLRARRFRCATENSGFADLVGKSGEDFLVFAQARNGWRCAIEAMLSLWMRNAGEGVEGHAFLQEGDGAKAF